MVDVAYCDFLIRDVNSYKIDLQYTVNTNQILNCFILKKPFISWPPLLNFFKRTTSGSDLVLTGELYCLVKILTANCLRSINCHALMVIPQSVFQSTATCYCSAKMVHCESNFYYFMILQWLEVDLCVFFCLSDFVLCSRF